MKTIVVQAGHIAPREPGFESGTGTAGEQEFVRAIRDRLVAILKADGRFKPVPLPGKIPHGIKCDAALFLHADGSGNKTASGYSFGYPNYQVNITLARMIHEEFQKLPGHPSHHRDNYTRDLAGYYGFSRVDTAGPEVLVEHGFLTNISEAVWLKSHIDALAHAEYRALLRYFGMVAEPKPKPKLPKISGHWQITLTFADGHTKTYAKVGSYRLWAIRQGNLRKKGVRDVKSHWVETA